MDLSQLNIPESLDMGRRIVTCTIEGILELEDLRCLVAEDGETLEEAGDAPAVPSLQVIPDDPSDLKKIREKHHSVARLIASGLSQRMVAQLAGYTEPYISILLNNPSMQSLVEMYRVQHGAATAVITEKLKTVGLRAVEKLEEKLDVQDGLNNQELLGLAKLALDRGGVGPASHKHVTQENHNIDYAKLADLNAEARRRNTEFIVPVTEMKQLPKASDETN